ncbi:amidohydrolase family protein [Rutstroemia sp. NJR-2017a BBW]|nr:amidohydrolase family protein [Rutstroemia sp. NJR-2017a BBW]
MSEISVATEFRLRYITPRRRSIIGIPLPCGRKVGKIDTQHQMIPPAYRNCMQYHESWGVKDIKERSEVGKVLQPPDWSPTLSLSFMAQNSISISILSFAYAPLHESTLCQEINTYAYKLRLQYPTKFGFFATLPSIDEASIPEVLSSIKFCYESLDADGVTLFTSYEGKYLGEEVFGPVFEELNRLHAVILIYPITNSAVPTTLTDSSIPQMVDLRHEITRTACSLICSNTMSVYPNLKMILSYGGGTLPYVSGGIEGSVDKSAADVRREARRFYASSMGVSNAEMEITENFFGSERMMCGSNFPFGEGKNVLRRGEILRRSVHESEARSTQAMKESTLKLFPRLQRELEISYQT